MGADIARAGGRRPGDGRKKEARYLRDGVRSRVERPPGGTALNQGSVVGSGFSGAFKCFRSCLECRKRLSETKAETAFLIGSRGVGLLPILHLSLAPRPAPSSSFRFLRLCLFFRRLSLQPSALSLSLSLLLFLTPARRRRGAF